MGDLNKFQERYIALRQAMIADGLDKGVPFLDKDLHTVIERLRCEGTSFVQVTLPLLGKALDLGLVSGTFSCIAQFRLRKESRLPLFLYSLFRRIFDDEGAILIQPDVLTIRFCRLFLLFDSKLLFEPSSKMRDETVSGFQDRMQTLCRVRIPTDNPILLKA
jgi:hypothetical protein